MLPTQCAVIRDGADVTVNGSDLVVGDVVRVTGGNKVPADLRVLQSSDLKVWVTSRGLSKQRHPEFFYSVGYSYG